MENSEGIGEYKTYMSGRLMRPRLVHLANNSFCLASLDRTGFPSSDNFSQNLGLSMKVTIPESDLELIESVYFGPLRLDHFTMETAKQILDYAEGLAEKRRASYFEVTAQRNYSRAPDVSVYSGNLIFNPLYNNIESPLKLESDNSRNTIKRREAKEFFLHPTAHLYIPKK